MYLRIANKGEIELAALFLVGASTKEGDTSKIGFFGSGNKYALATLLRNDIGLRIFSGSREIAVETRSVDFRGEVFDQIFIDGTPTSFTTRMGPTWETWFALREFICNALDEGDFEIGLTRDINGQAGSTTIYVEATSEVMSFFGSLDSYIFLGTPIFTTATRYGQCAIIREAEELNIYRKGICVTPEEQRLTALFHYDFASIDINESRVFMYEFQVRDRIAATLARAPRAIVERFLPHAVDSKYVESNADWNDAGSAFSNDWEEILRDKTIMAEKYVNFAPVEDVMAAIILPDILVERLLEQWPTLHAWGIQGGQYREVDYDGDAIPNAVAEAQAYGYLAEGIFLKTVLFEKEGIMASYNSKKHEIAIDVRYVDDYDELVTTLIEEGLHAHGYRDGTRDFEQFLMRELVVAQRKACSK